VAKHDFVLVNLCSMLAALDRQGTEVARELSEKKGKRVRRVMAGADLAQAPEALRGDAAPLANEVVEVGQRNSIVVGLAFMSAVGRVTRVQAVQATDANLDAIVRGLPRGVLLMVVRWGVRCVAGHRPVYRSGQSSSAAVRALQAAKVWQRLCSVNRCTDARLQVAEGAAKFKLDKSLTQ
jgi:hypothetical protein